MATSEKHFKVHENGTIFKCNFCDKHFGKLIYLNKHVKIMHEYAKTLKCEYCDESFSDKEYLERHVCKD